MQISHFPVPAVLQTKQLAAQSSHFLLTVLKAVIPLQESALHSPVTIQESQFRLQGLQFPFSSANLFSH